MWELFALLGTITCVSAQARSAAKLQGECGTLYTVVSGDGCWSITNSAHITQAQLAALNPTLDCNTLFVGQGLCLGLPCEATYEVQSGDWCAKIYDEQHITAEALLALNPGFSCDEIFPSQRLCKAAPTTPTPTDPTPPTELPTPTPEPYPVVPCKIKVAVSQGDTCYNLAAANGIQLAQFLALNENLDCDKLQAGAVACVLPACGEVYRVESGDWCARIEEEYHLSSGKLTDLNPGLSCANLAAGQMLCVEPPLEEEPEEPSPPSFKAWSPFPVLSPGLNIPQSPLLSFFNAEDPRDTFMGRTLFQFDGQHVSNFAKVDLNGDGFLDASELTKLVLANPSYTRGLTEVDENMSLSNIVNYIITSVDKNGDNRINETEYMSSIIQAQTTTNEAAEAAAERRAKGLSNKLEKRFPWLLVGAFIALVGTVAVGIHMDQMEKQARKKAGKLLDYIDLVYWERGKEPEPKCAAYMYYSTSCAALGHHWSSHCSEGGEKVFEDSCRGLFKEGSLACGFASFGCSSLCWKVSTEGCSCDALKYTSENNRVYQDPFLSSTTEKTVGNCRNRCGTTSNCAGFSVSPIDDYSLQCKTYRTMSSPTTADRAVSFRLVGGPVGSGDNPLCPRIPDGYAPRSVAQLEHDAEVGERIAADYADTLQARSLQTRAPRSYDPRTKYPLTRKNQGETSLCVSFTLSTMIEGSVKVKYDRTAVNDISPIWIAVCRAQQTSLTRGNKMYSVLDAVGNSYSATEGCMPWRNRDNPGCQSNQCGQSSYGKLPYVTDRVFVDAPVNGGKKNWEKIKDHLINFGPVSLSIEVTNSFRLYAQTLSSQDGDKVFYDKHPDYPAATCVYEGHDVTIIGYGHFTKPGESRQRLYWIVQNSWGISSGKNGYVFIAAGSLGSAERDSYGIKVRESSPFFDKLALPGDLISI